MALGKEGNLGTDKVIFAECCCQGTRQRDWQRGPLEDSLPSASPPDTRQSSLLCRVPTSALGTGTGCGAHWTCLCRVPRKTLGKGSVTVTWRRNGDFFYRVPDKKYSAKRLLPMYSSPSILCQVLHSAKPLPSVK
jgi:hypothetical protein